jgi:hypothetical protein
LARDDKVALPYVPPLISLISFRPGTNQRREGRRGG